MRKNWICGICNKRVGKGSASCNSCLLWVHLKCSKTTTKKAIKLGASFICLKCKKAKKEKQKLPGTQKDNADISDTDDSLSNTSSIDFEREMILTDKYSPVVIVRDIRDELPASLLSNAFREEENIVNTVSSGKYMQSLNKVDGIDEKMSDDEASVNSHAPSDRINGMSGQIDTTEYNLAHIPTWIGKETIVSYNSILVRSANDEIEDYCFGKENGAVKNADGDKIKVTISVKRRRDSASSLEYGGNAKRHCASDGEQEIRTCLGNISSTFNSQEPLNRDYSSAKILEVHKSTPTACRKQYKRQVCERELTPEKELKTRVNIHTNQEQLKCAICNKLFMLKSNLKMHLVIHGGQEQFKCDICGKAFMHKGHLKLHMMCHTDEKQFKCELCNKFFMLKSNLRMHSMIHTDHLKFGMMILKGKKQFICEICGKAFKQKGNLELHIMIHGGQKQFKCEICDKSFLVKSNLKVHMKFHTGQKQFKCEICSKSFTLKDNLKMHLIFHTGQKQFKCEICCKSFVLKVNLEMHKKIHMSQRQFKFVEYGEFQTKNRP